MTATLTDAQPTAFRRQEKPGDWLIGVTASASRYAGDLSERYNIKHLQLGWSAQAHARWRLHESLCIRAETGIYYLHARQQYTQNAANMLAFYTTNLSLNLDLEIDALPVDFNMQNILYGVLGGGITNLDPQTTLNGKVIKLTDFNTEGTKYARWVGQFRYGLGIPFALSRWTQIRVEGTYTHVLSDYLDDVSTVYTDKAAAPLLEAQVADPRRLVGLEPNVAGAQRGNPGKRDGYFLITFQAVYKFH